MVGSWFRGTARSIANVGERVGESVGSAVMWFVVNGGFWALAGLWMFGNHQWAWNLFRFLGIVAVVSILMYLMISFGVEDEPEKLEDILSDIDEGPTRAVPTRVSQLLHWGGSLVLAAAGHFFWATLIIVTVWIREGAFRKIERVWEEHYAD